MTQRFLEQPKGGSTSSSSRSWISLVIFRTLYRCEIYFEVISGAHIGLPNDRVESWPRTFGMSSSGDRYLTVLRGHHPPRSYGYIV